MTLQELYVVLSRFLGISIHECTSKKQFPEILNLLLQLASKTPLPTSNEPLTTPSFNKHKPCQVGRTESGAAERMDGNVQVNTDLVFVTNTVTLTQSKLESI